MEKLKIKNLIIIGISLAGCMLCSAPQSYAQSTEDHAFRQALKHQVLQLRESRQAWQRVVNQPLLRVWRLSQSNRDDWRDMVNLPRHLVRAGLIRAEVLHAPDVRDLLIQELEDSGAVIESINVRGNWIQAAIEINDLPWIAVLPGIGSIGLAPLPEPSGTTSEAVELGNAHLWHDESYDGDGVTIAVIDSFADQNGEVDELQNTGDWPLDSQLETIRLAPGCNGGGFGSCSELGHGNAVLELIYDIAPGAYFLAYDGGRTYDSIIDAVDKGADIINMSIYRPNDTPGDGSAPPGSWAEAIEVANDAGTLVVISAGNTREGHWGGQFSGSGSWHQWGVEDWLNGRLTSAAGRCIANGESFSASMTWNDWSTVTHDYDLVLIREDGDGLEQHEVSSNLQDGQSGQRPYESISATAETENAHPDCGPGEAQYAWAILNVSASGDHNFRFWSSNLERRLHASSLTPPSDSPAAFTVGAIHEGSGFASYSSEGPILSPGGGAPTGNEHPKPDLVSYAGVTTSSLGTFFGTSASAPHVSGYAALLLQRHRWAYDYYSGTELAARLREIGQQGSNDMGPTGHDFRSGWGRLHFQPESQIDFLAQPSDTPPNESITPSVSVEILDPEGNRVLSGPTQFLDVEIGQDPSNGQATLYDTLPKPVIDGVGVLSELKIDYPGGDYTLVVSSSTISAESSPFDIIERIFSDRFED